MASGVREQTNKQTNKTDPSLGRSRCQDRRPFVAESQAGKLTGTREAGKRKAPKAAVNTRCKGSVGARACKFVVQPTPNMRGLGGSTERPAVQWTAGRSGWTFWRLTHTHIQGKQSATLQAASVHVSGVETRQSQHCFFYVKT